MRKLLLGTTALVAAAGLATSASAQTSEPVKIRVGGYYSAAAGFLAQTENSSQKAGFGHRDHSFKQDTEVHFLGETKLDNGLIVGVHFELEGTDQPATVAGSTVSSTSVVSGDQIDETWMYFKGSWGELRFGDEDDARKLKAYSAPVADPDGTVGVDSPNLAFSNSPLGTNTTTVNVENDQTKIIYFSPSIFGFSFAASYAPDGNIHASRSGQGGNAGGQFGAAGGNLPVPAGSTPLTTNAGNSNNWSIAANYDGKFGDFTIGAGLGYTEGTPERNLNNLAANTATVGADLQSTVHAFRGGGVVGFGPFKFGGSFEQVQGITDTVNATQNVGGTGFTSRRFVWNVGGTYTIGPFSVGLAGTWGQFYHPFGLPLTQQASNNQYALTASYLIGPGIRLLGMISHQDYGSGAAYSNGGAGTGTILPGNVTTGITAPFGVERDMHDTAIVIGTRIVF
jgi:outer membrane protein OmpU